MSTLNIGQRIKEERERLGLTQPQFADAACEAKKRTLIDWEKGATSPTAVQLSALAAIGADVLYILTGKKTVGGVAEDPTQYQMGLSEPEKALLRNFRICGDSDRAVIERLAEALAKDTFP